MMLDMFVVFIHLRGIHTSLYEQNNGNVLTTFKIQKMLSIVQPHIIGYSPLLFS
jgi:hypothetical protein